jgi:hypothetical protein
MKRFIVVAILIATYSGLGTWGWAQGRSQGRGRGEQSKEAKPAAKPEAKPDPKGGPVFGSGEIRIIRDWFGNPTNLKGLPPGLAKRESLPPGLEKQLRRNGSLPPGLEKKIHPFPRDLEVRLPRLPDGQRRMIIPGNIILMDTRRNTILDILANVF